MFSDGMLTGLLTGERMAYSKRRQSGISMPESYLSIISDDMTKFTTSLPHFRYKTKSNDTGEPLGFALTGSIVHGYGIFGHFTTDEFGKHKSNTPCKVLQDVLNCIVEDRGFLPDTLYYQADNYLGSNKNHIMFGYLGKLVQLGVFKEIQVSWLHEFTPG